MDHNRHGDYGGAPTIPSLFRTGSHRSSSSTSGRIATPSQKCNCNFSTFLAGATSSRFLDDPDSNMMSSLCFTDVELSDGTDCVVFSQVDLPNGAFPVMEDIRRKGQLIGN